MEVEINAGDGVRRSDALDGHVHEALRRLGRRFGDRLTRVRVFLKDVNARKGGIDKVCSMEARPAGAEPVGVEAQDADVYRAVGRAADKLEKAVGHRMACAAARE